MRQRHHRQRRRHRDGATAAVAGLFLSVGVVGAFRAPPSSTVPGFSIREHNRGVRSVSSSSSSLLAFSATADTSDNVRIDSDVRIDSETWTFRGKYPVAYEVAQEGTSLPSIDAGATPILLLNGFGVGSFHQHLLMNQLASSSSSSTRYVVYGVDYLGQGRSWPADCDDGNSEDERGLSYSADVWVEQIIGFLDEVVLANHSHRRRKEGGAEEAGVHVLGNSLGGYLASFVASRRPDLVSALVLANATPVWGLNLPFWSGQLPPPDWGPRFLGRFLFDQIRNPDIVRQYLEAAYENAEAFENDGLGGKIRACTEGNGGHAAFASILFSGPLDNGSGRGGDGEDADQEGGFYGALRDIECDVLLLFGSADPWCTPAIAKKMHVTLASRSLSSSRYVALENAGHCPNHEAPVSVARVMRPWLDTLAEGRTDVVLVENKGEGEWIEPSWGGRIVAREVELEESANLGLIDRIVSSLAG